MPAIIATFRIVGISSYSQSEPILIDREPNESHDDFRKRTWREFLHVDQNGMVFIPPGAIKNGVSEAAKFMDISVPGKGKNKYTKHIEAGVACIKPIELGIKAKD